MEDALGTYRKKRDFNKTPEPAPGKRPAPGGRRFCVQKHAANRLHYDLRLEIDGVMKSWAVTKGPSLDPSDKRLAVRTEDHPVSYNDFEGTIPKDEYGGGTVMLWDHGRWAPSKDDVARALKDGELSFILHGKRMKGQWALVRMNSNSSDKRENWLLIKKKDDESSSGTSLTEEHTTSVKTGRSMSEIENERGSRKKSSKSNSEPPSWTEPVLCKLVDEPPEGEDWIHEMKYDGYRLQAAIGRGKARLYTRNGKDWSDRFSALCEDLCALDCDTALIDGEVAVLTEAGLTDFSQLQASFTDPDIEIAYFAFDLIELDGKSLKKTPLAGRKAELARLMNGVTGALRYADHVANRGSKVFEAACEHGAEGVVSKKANSLYRAGRSGIWVKTKCEHREEAVIVGWNPSDKTDRGFASLLLATCEDGDWIYRGRAGTGFDARTRAALRKALDQIPRKTSPLGTPPESLKDVRWVTPKLVAEIRYTGRTPDGLFRHAAFLGLREDKAPGEVSAEPAKTGKKTG